MGDPKELTPGDVAKRLGDFLPVDVRGPHEFEGPLGHVAGAVLIPLPELEARAAELPRNRALLLICRSGVRSAKACQLLEAHGFGPATNLAGGMIAWNHAGLERAIPRYADAAGLLDNALAWLAQVTAQPRDAVRADLMRDTEDDDVARALDWIEARARAAGTPPDTDLSLAAFRAAFATL